MGTGFALGLPAMLALIPSLVPRERLSQAVSMNAAGINVARLAGPAIGGGVLAAFGATVCFAVNAVSFLALVVVLLRLAPRPAAVRAGGPTRMREALAHARHDRAIRRLLVGMALFTALASPIQELAPVVADRLDAGARGPRPAARGDGRRRAPGRLVARAPHRPRPAAAPGPADRDVGVRRRPRRGGGDALAVARAARMAFSGAFWIWMFAATNTAMQLNAPPALLGRLLGLYQLSVIGPIAVGSTIAGAVAEVAGIEATLLGCAALLAAWGVWSMRNAGRRDRRGPRRRAGVRRRTRRSRREPGRGTRPSTWRK